MSRFPNSILVTGGAGFIASNLVLTLQERMPNARLTVIDDFRSGDFKNLAGYKGDFVAQDLATLDWQQQFGDERFDAIFHLASITDTTLHDQFVQTHDNVESFRRLLNFARPNKTRVIYASSASTYGAASAASAESNGAAPTNVYAFSKAMMDNLATRVASDVNGWIIVGLRYFNVYGPREAHKGLPASMVLHLSRQMKARATTANLQTRRTETRFRLRKGYCRRKHPRSRGKGERYLQFGFRTGAVIQRTRRHPEPLVRHQS